MKSDFQIVMETLQEYNEEVPKPTHIKLPEKQAELLCAIQRGEVVHYFDYDSYYYLSNPFERCTAQVKALEKKGLVRIEKMLFRNRRVLLTKAGEKWEQ